MQNILAHRLLSTRGGTLVLGAIAALLAAIILLVYLNRYRESVSSSAAPQTVLVAKSLIPKGTAGTLVGSRELFQPATLPGDQVKEGAVTDPAALKGRVAVDDVYPGQQLTTADFSAAKTDAIATKLTGAQRAISIGLDQAHGNVGQLEVGDEVDVWGVIKVRNDITNRETDFATLLAPKALVLKTPEGPEGGAGASGAETAHVVLRVNGQQAAKMAFTTDNGILWMILRPRASAAPTRPSLVDVQSLLVGAKPLRVKEVAK
jgi:Flp pilus assembly protein CpaB